MHTSDRARVILHAAIVLLVGLLCGVPTTVEQVNGNERHWHTAHEALIMMGIWMMVTASILPSLSLEEREASALRWSAVGMGYAFVAALVVGAMIGADAFEPGGTPLRLLVFVCAILGIFLAVMTASITIRGALGALRMGTER